MKELTLEEAALAWAQGKKVEATAVGGMGEFYSISPIGSKSGRWNPLVFNGDGHRFRLAPEPPAKKFRPWKIHEVPVGALTRMRLDVNKGNPSRQIIEGENGTHLFLCGVPWTLETLLDTREHSLDGGKTWLPCGVEVDA